MRRPTRTAALVLLLTLLGALPLQATGLTDPPLRFRQVRTPHFIIYFHDGEDRLAQRLSLMVEAVRTELASRLGLTAPERTHVILADQSELANGWATPLPRNIVFLHPAAPSGAEFVGRTDDWLRLVFTHEYTHILHLDRSTGWARVLRVAFGRSPLVFPNLWLPEWQIEGLATWHESASQGRRHAGDFRAIERVNLEQRRPEPIDRLNGGLVRWPGGYASYAYGLGFHEYLATRYGDKSLGDLATSTSRHFPFAGSLAFKGVYGQSLGSLWRSYTAEVENAARASSTAERRSAVQQLTNHGQVVVAPRFAPAACDGCSDEIVYTVRNPRTFPELRSIGRDGTGDRALTTRYLGKTVGVTRDAIVFDQQEIRRNIGSYSDLHVLDRRTGKIVALTHNERLQDPDIAHDGSAVVVVRQRRGERDLVLLHVGGPLTGQSRRSANRIETLASAADVQFNTPRWSPDDRSIVAERRRLGALPELVLIDARTHEIRVLASDRDARIVTPTWKPDGTAVVAAADFDGGAFDLYEFPLDGSEARRVTRSSGAFWPDVSADGSTLVFAGYTAAGFDLFRTPLSPIESPRALHPSPAPSLADSSAESANVGAQASTGPGPARPYSPLDTLAPTSWAPLVTSDAGQTRVGAAVYGADLLARHLYAAELTWLTNAPGDAPARPGTPDWGVGYTYTRWQPSFFVSSSRDTTFLRVGGASPGGTPAVLRELEFQSGVLVPVVHARTSQQYFASIDARQADRLLPDASSQTWVVASRAGIAVNTARVYGYSISPQDGVRVGTTMEWARERLGSDANATVVTGDARAYLPGFREHQVLALRVAGGRSTGSTLAGRLFTLGGADASTSTLDFSSSALALLRGFSPNRFSGTRVEVMNAEYRFPISRVERGTGTWPVFVRWVHGAVFADAGRVSGGGFARTWKSSLGAEGSVDFVAGYHWPLTATVGVATTRDGSLERGVSVYARIGRAF